MSVFIDIHALHTVPYANLNRDGENSPKSMIFGGVERIRVSSQAWKRAIRHDVEAAAGERAARTRRLPGRIAETLAGRGWPSDLAGFAGRQVAASAEKALKLDETGGETSVLLYLPESALVDLADLCEQHKEALAAAAGRKKSSGAVLPTAEVTALITGRTATINLFGRMLAELPAGNVDGAVQVAHAFTTHQSDAQGDFFTAVDDWLDPSKVGSGHMNIGEFSAGVFYRYATLNVDDLVRNLGDTTQARELAGLFLTHFLYALPQAKRTATAPHTVPDLAYLAVRGNRPVSLAAAFELPVRRGYEGGLLAPSADRLAAYAAQLDTLIGTDTRRFHGHAGTLDKLAQLGEHKDAYRDLIDAAVTAAFTDPGADAA